MQNSTAISHGSVEAPSMVRALGLPERAPAGTWSHVILALAETIGT